MKKLHLLSPRTESCAYSSLPLTRATAVQVVAIPRTGAVKGSAGRWLAQGEWVHGPHFGQMLRKAGYRLR